MDTCANSRIINMSIAALLKAAEYIDRRDRGELDFLCLNCQSSAVYAHVNMAPVYFCRGTISWFWRNGSVACCRRRARVRVKFAGFRGAQERRKADEDEEVSGQQVSDRRWQCQWVSVWIVLWNELKVPRTCTKCMFFVPGRLITNWKKTGEF